MDSTLAADSGRDPEDVAMDTLRKLLTVHDAVVPEP